MVRFAGYAKKEDPKWVSLVVYAGIFILVLAVLFGLSLLGQWTGNLLERKNEPTSTTTSTSTSSTAASPSTAIAAMPPTAAFNMTSTTLSVSPSIAPKKSLKEVISNGGVTVDRMAVSSMVSGGAPADEIDSISQTAGRVYCFTTLSSSSVPQAVKHVWLRPDGSVYADIELTVSKAAANTWSYITLTNTVPGTWKVQVRDAGNNVIGERSFEITE